MSNFPDNPNRQCDWCERPAIRIYLKSQGGKKACKRHLKELVAARVDPVVTPTRVVSGSLAQRGRHGKASIRAGSMGRRGRW